jgi:hypothetical protein
MNALACHAPSDSCEKNLSCFFCFLWLWHYVACGILTCLHLCFDMLFTSWCLFVFSPLIRTPVNEPMAHLAWPHFLYAQSLNPISIQALILWYQWVEVTIKPTIFTLLWNVFGAFSSILVSSHILSASGLNSSIPPWKLGYS